MQSIGLDIVATERIRKAYARHGDRFARRILSPNELQLLELRRDKVEFIAGRFAAKEAVIKALGKFLKTRPGFSSIQINYAADGQPIVIFPSEIAARLAGHKCLISLSHEKTNSAAVAIIVEDK